MILNTNRFFSDRMVFDDTCTEKLRVTNSLSIWCLRFISLFYSPASYTAENRKTIELFEKYLINSIGSDQLKRICTRYSIDFEKMKKKGSCLVSRDVAKIVIGAKTHHIMDLKQSGEKIDVLSFGAKVASRSMLINSCWKVEDLKEKLTGRPSKWFSRRFFDPFLADRERLKICEEFPEDTFETFLHDACARMIKREMDVGMVIPAPKRKSDGALQYYYVSGKRITGKGMVSYILHPCAFDSDLKAVQLFRGTAPRNGEIDASSTIITDLEKNLGKKAFESGNVYEKDIAELVNQPKIEAGHSLGSNIVQWRLANLNHIEEVYLFNGPGLPIEEVLKFNQSKKNVRLVVFHSMQDDVQEWGSVQLGFCHPENVRLDYYRYLRSSCAYHHTSVVGREKRWYSIEGGIPANRRDQYFDNRNRTKERLRATIGPFFSKAMASYQRWIRSSFCTRTVAQIGLQLYVEGKGSWDLHHILR